MTTEKSFVFVFLESDLKIYGCDDRIVAWSTF